MEHIEGMSGVVYSPKEKNKVIYEYFNNIRNLKEAISASNKQVTSKINYIEKEFRMTKGEYKEWISLKLAEINKDDISKVAAVELDYELKRTREAYGADEQEDRIERNCDYEDEPVDEVEEGYGE